MGKLLSGLLLAAMLLAQAALAGTAALADPALEQRVLTLSEQLRCLVCQNQTIAESHAELAIDLRNQVREQLAQGRGEQQVIDYMVARYGDFVLYKPPVKPMTWLLWYGPVLLAAGGLGLLAWQLRRRGGDEAAPAPEALAQAARLLADDAAAGEPS